MSIQHNITGLKPPIIDVVGNATTLSRLLMIQPIVAKSPIYDLITQGKELESTLYPKSVLKFYSQINSIERIVSPLQTIIENAQKWESLYGVFQQNSWYHQLFQNSSAIITHEINKAEDTLIIDLEVEKLVEVYSPEEQKMYLNRYNSVKTLVNRIRSGEIKLPNITPHDFEDLIAELLYNQGFKVEQSKRTRDGGYDMLAYISDSLNDQLKYVVECKHYQKSKVGVEIVRAFRSVVKDQGANRGLVVTSSYFTKDAVLEAGKEGNLISLKDFNSVSNWLIA